MRAVVLTICSAVVLNGCVSIATHEEQLRRCRAAAMNADALQARVTDLEKQNDTLEKRLANKSAESEKLQSEISDTRATYDELVDKLKADVKQGDVGLSQADGNVTITLGDKVLFQSGQWELQPRGRQVLLQVANILKKSDKSKIIQVEGHTDNVPISGSLKARFPSNWDLSSARAAAVVRYLQEQGIPGERLTLTAYGDTHPIADNRTPDGRRTNRRVGISLVEKH